MAWQSKFSEIFGPGLFAGITAGDWLGLLRDVRFAMHPRFALRCVSITWSSLANSMYARIEQWRHGRHIEKATIQPPLFVLGHWRSGTTYLHHLLSQDDRFAFPSLYQVLYPHTFLTTEAVNTRLLSFLVPRTRFGLDNVEIDWNVPYEDEFAIATMSFLSPYMSLVLPHKQQYFDQFLTLENASPSQVDQWKTALTTFLKKLTWKHGRPLILKSPGHTCRIKLLLELFPEAKFVHIRRDPFRVFQSWQRALAATLRYWKLQDARRVDWEERAIQQYREMYDVYFDQQRLVPNGRLHEMSFEDVEADPVEQLRRAYEALALPDFGHVEPRLREYVAARDGYVKNEFPELPGNTRKRLVQEWRACFEKWNYPTT